MDEVVAYTQTVNGLTSRFYPHSNHLYSVAALTDASGAVVERYTYDAYGKQTITDASGNMTRAKSAVGWDRSFTGYVVDNETGLLYARSRMYSPGLGRFANRDSIPMSRFGVRAGNGYHDGFLLYQAYFIPNGVDPTGRFDCSSYCSGIGCTLSSDAIVDRRGEPTYEYVDTYRDYWDDSIVYWQYYDRFKITRIESTQVCLCACTVCIFTFYVEKTEVLHTRTERRYLDSGHYWRPRFDTSHVWE